MKANVLRNGGYFLANYETVSRRNLPSNVTIRRNRTIRPRGQRKRKTQQGARLLGSVFNLGKNLLTSETLEKGLDVGSKVISSEIKQKANRRGNSACSRVIQIQ